MNLPSRTGAGAPTRLRAAWAEEEFTCGFTSGRVLARGAPIHLSLRSMLRRVQALRSRPYPSSYSRQRAFKRRFRLVAEAREYLDFSRGVAGLGWRSPSPLDQPSAGHFLVIL